MNLVFLLYISESHLAVQAELGALYMLDLSKSYSQDTISELLIVPDASKYILAWLIRHSKISILLYVGEGS